VTTSLLSQPALTTTSSFNGVFELHLTVAAPGAEGGRFREACLGLGLKPILIEAPGAQLTLQPMTSSYHRGSLDEVVGEARRLAAGLEQAGFEVVRSKIEATLGTLGVPADDQQALAGAPERYFEFHAKVALPPGADLSPLRGQCEALGARLSSNAFRVQQSGLQERFVTLRAYRVGRVTALGQFQELLGALRAAGFAPGHLLHEYMVADTNCMLDQGWIALPCAARPASPRWAAAGRGRRPPLPAGPGQDDGHGRGPCAAAGAREKL